MRVLLADDDPTARLVLTSVFTKLGHQPTAVENGTKALQLALQEPYPEILVLDWMMPGLTGPEVARKIRENEKQLPFRPYIIILTSKRERTEAALALNDGADDFMSKPPDATELTARLRVAERMIAHEIELRASITQLTRMIERHELLGEMVVTRHAQGEASSTGAFDRGEFQGLITAAFQQFKTVILPVDQARGVTFQNPLSVWDAVVLPRHGVWIDIILDIPQATARQVFEQSLHRPPDTKRESESFIIEAHSLIRKIIQTKLKNSGLENIAPFVATATTQDRGHVDEGTQAYYFSTEHGPLRVVIIHSMCATIEKAPRQVNALDLLPRGFPPDAPMPIINANTAIDNSLRHRLRHFADDMTEPPKVPVIEPSETARWFHRSPG